MDGQTIIYLLFILLLATFLGFELISKVPATLHTPLMSGSNAISGITLLGAISLTGQSEEATALSSILGFLAVTFAMTNVVGGYLVTDRMLEMFKKKDTNKISLYKNYLEYEEKLSKATPHRIMAVRRGESDNVLSVKINADKDEALLIIKQAVVNNKDYSQEVIDWILEVAQDSYTRLLFPSIETQIRIELKRFAEDEAINVFSRNLEKLLMLPILPNKKVLGIDPGLRTGFKAAVVDQHGSLEEHATFYPKFKDLESESNNVVIEKFVELIKKYEIKYISLGNGTGSSETRDFIELANKRHDILDEVVVVTVNEAGASVYSVSDIAQEEFPDLDATIRSAISIARRLQDPLAELVKIDPKSIGIGQYQHDCNPARLNQNLKDTIESCTNQVGVNLNSASYKLLEYISGIGPSLAKEIINHRSQNGAFKSRQDLLQVKGMGDKTFEQAAGFLRIPESKNILDNSSIHPECYDLVNKIEKDQNLTLEDIIGKEEKLKEITWENYLQDNIGLPTLHDIRDNLQKPARDPRKICFKRPVLNKGLKSIQDLRIGMNLKGLVSNVTNFGVFVDLGIHQDGLVHISELSGDFIKDPASSYSINQEMQVTIVGVDLQRNRISLSCKAANKPAYSHKPLKKSEIKFHKKEQGSYLETKKVKKEKPSRKPSKYSADKSSFAGKTVKKIPNVNLGQSFSASDLLDKFNNH